MQIHGDPLGVDIYTSRNIFGLCFASISAYHIQGLDLALKLWFGIWDLRLETGFHFRMLLPLWDLPVIQAPLYEIPPGLLADFRCLLRVYVHGLFGTSLSLGFASLRVPLVEISMIGAILKLQRASFDAWRRPAVSGVRFVFATGRRGCCRKFQAQMYASSGEFISGVQGH